MTTSTDEPGCRFDPRVAFIPPDVNGTASFQYDCSNCGQWHWAIPELEVDGTEATAEAARTAIEDALDRWYMAAAGVTRRDAVRADPSLAHERPEWRPGDVPPAFTSTSTST